MIEEIESEEVAAQRARDRMSAFGSKLQRLADERVAGRIEIEKRWLEDLYQYNGKYDSETQSRLAASASKSKVFVNITRPKSNTIEARLVDMLFPTDDKNWGIDPTPVPRLGEALRDEDPAVRDAANMTMAIAKERAESMERRSTTSSRRPSTTSRRVT